MPATDTGSQLLRAVLEDPADDTVRLVYADWLAEHGEEEYGEFIRVQVRLARTCPGDAPYRPALRVRERELWAGLVGAAHDNDGTLWGLPVERVTVPSRPTEYDRETYVVSRGFVSALTCDARTFLGGKCGRCGGRGDGRWHPDDIMLSDCPACDGTGRTPGVAAELFARHPIERVTFPGREPYHNAVGCWLWVVGGSPGSPNESAQLPDELFRLLTGDVDVRNRSSWRTYRTRDLALSALSDAGVRRGRKHAGLPPIPRCTPPHT